MHVLAHLCTATLCLFSFFLIKAICTLHYIHLQGSGISYGYRVHRQN